MEKISERSCSVNKFIPHLKRPVFLSFMKITSNNIYSSYLDRQDENTNVNRLNGNWSGIGNSHSSLGRALWAVPMKKNNSIEFQDWCR